MTNDHIPFPPDSPANLLTTLEAAHRAKCPRRLLYDLRYFGLGPPVQKLANGELRYEEKQLTDWIAALPGPVYQSFDWAELAKKRSNANARRARKERSLLRYKYSTVNVKRGKWSLRSVAS